MWFTVLKILLSAVIIAFVSWLSGKKTGLAGFLTALPLVTLIALVFSRFEYSDPKLSVEYAKSIFVAIPISLMFFVPFLLASRFQWNFWTCYLAGLFLLGVGYYIHQFIVRIFL